MADETALHDVEAAALYLDRPLRGVLPVIVSMLFTGRNAWHSTWVQRYQRNVHLFPTARAARIEAERRRTRGTVFYIAEWPALRFAGDNCDLLAVEFYTPAPFATWLGVDPDCRAGGPTLLDVRQALSAPDRWHKDAHERRVTTVTAPSVQRLRSLRRYEALIYTSRANGSNESLRWDVDTMTVQRTAIYGHVKRLEEARREEPEGSATHASLQALRARLVSNAAKH